MHTGNDSGERNVPEKSPVLIGTFFFLNVKGTSHCVAQCSQCPEIVPV